MGWKEGAEKGEWEEGNHRLYNQVEEQRHCTGCLCDATSAQTQAEQMSMYHCGCIISFLAMLTPARMLFIPEHLV